MRTPSPFELYLRTGRRQAAAAPTELKFNPWHDPDDGRFTFAGQGRYFPRGYRSAEPESGGGAGRPRNSAAGKPGAGIRSGRSGWKATDPRHPRNHSLYTIRQGDSLTRIARLRRGLTAEDLAWLNGIPADRPLHIGQKLKLPHQQFLDVGKRARDTFLALAHYMKITGGKLPPNVAKPPSVAVQIEASGVREIRANGYSFDIDMLLRTRRAGGEIRLQRGARSRSAQANAGKPDRRSSDHGGHFIAARFNGPREWFNHFAQDAGFNRREYSALENESAKLVRSGKRVFVNIIPRYHGTSKRPPLLVVEWTVDGFTFSRRFPNEKRGR